MEQRETTTTTISAAGDPFAAGEQLERGRKLAEAAISAPSDNEDAPEDEWQYNHVAVLRGLDGCS